MFNILKPALGLVRVATSLTFGIPLRIIEALGQLLPANAWGCRGRGLIYKPLLKSCGRNFQVAIMAKLEHLNNIEIGNDVYIGHGCWISGLRGGIQLDDEVMLGPFVTMVSSNHRFVEGSARFPQGVGGPIRVGAGSWLASGVAVTAGVTVGRSCLVAAGCVLTSDLPDETIAGGVPGRVLGSTRPPLP